MRVILLKDVPRLGRRGEVKEVAPGFGRNVLIPKRQAELATSSTLAQAKANLAAAAGTAQKEANVAEQAAATLEGTTVTLKGRASAEGHLFAALHPEDVVAAIKREKNLELKPAAITLAAPLKSLGLHQAKAHLGERVVGFNILIIPLER